MVQHSSILKEMWLFNETRDKTCGSVYRIRQSVICQLDCGEREVVMMVAVSSPLSLYCHLHLPVRPPHLIFNTAEQQ